MWKTCHGDIKQILASYMITFIQTTPPPPQKKKKKKKKKEEEEVVFIINFVYTSNIKFNMSPYASICK